MNRWVLLGIIIFLSLSPYSVYAENWMPDHYGSNGGLADDNLTIEKVLHYAIQDEYLAQARYDAIHKKFGQVIPFVQIKKVEQQHIHALLHLSDLYNISPPENNAADFTPPPTTLRQAFQASVQAEIDNINMYEKFISDEGLPQELRNTMNDIAKASRIHISTLKRGADNYYP
ncbi:hypothetical protein WAK64_16765 [Bacillus spongiae]|uniref:DUF2202 domain-containing protein n=1 Tax=Bacillus spongiae TaxID=2683610 RepID=A0ABU8HHE1_9BACI